MTHTLHRTQQLNCNLDTAWNFFSSPHNLSRITPPDMQFKVLTKMPEGSISEGMIIDYKISPIAGIPMGWQTVISQVTDKKSFTDFQQKGPYKLWNHFHEFIPNEKGVLMKDTVKYALPFGIIGDIAHTLFVRKKIQHIFDYRYQVLEKLFNTQNI